MANHNPLVGIDARTVYNNSTRGIGNYLRHLLTAMLPLEEYSFKLYYEREPAKKPFAISPLVQDRRLQIKGSRFFTWEQIALPCALRDDQVQLYHAAANTMPWWQPCPMVVTIHDVLLSRIDDDETSNYLFYWRKVLPRCVAKAKKIITVSEFSKRDLIDVWHVAPEKVVAIHSGSDPYYYQLPPEELKDLRVKYKLPERFIFTLGAQAPRKNTARVMEAFRRLKRETNTDCSFVISGLQPPMQEQLRASLQDDPIAREIIMLGFIEPEHLRFLYNTATVFIYASLYEGFGFPLLEAMSCGTPVATSNCSSLPEIAGDAAAYFNPEDTTSIVQCLHRVLSDAPLAQMLRTKGLRRAGHFDWARAARQTLDVYREVIG